MRVKDVWLQFAGQFLDPILRSTHLCTLVEHRQHDRAAVGAAWSADGEASVASYVGDGPDVAVVHPVVSVACRDLPVVAAGDDGVPDTRMGSVAQLDLSILGEGPVDEQVSSGSLVQFGHLFAGLGDEDGDASGVSVGPPGGVGGIGHGLGVAVLDAAVGEVGVDHGGVAVAEVEGGELLPRLVEAVDVDEFDGVGAVVGFMMLSRSDGLTREAI